MKTYVTVTRKTLIAVFLLTLFIIIVSGQFYAAENPPINAKTNYQRVAFIKSLGLLPDEGNYQSKSVEIPLKFSEVYNNYNDLQIRAGYNLSPYKGVKVTVYTYPIGRIFENFEDEYYVNLIVYNERIIGGDISSRNINGKMLPLTKMS